MSVKAYWRAIHKVARKTGRDVSEIRSDFKGQAQRVYTIAKSKHPGQSYGVNKFWSNLYRVQRESWGQKSIGELKTMYQWRLKYDRYALDRKNETRDGKRPKGVPARVWKEKSYVPRSGVNKGIRALYYNRHTGQYLTYREMRKHYEEIRYVKAAQVVANVLLKERRGLSLDVLPYELRALIPKSAFKRGYMSAAELIKFVKGIINRQKQQPLQWNLLKDIFPELEDYL